MGKRNRKLSYCTTEKLELDLSSCWIDEGTGAGHKCSKPSIKTVAITKSNDIKIKNRIGGFFKGHNIIAYGFNKDSLNIDVVFLLNGYACLYRAGSHTGNAANTTISLVSDQKPKELMQELAEAEIIVEKQGQGIYHFQYMFGFQIIVCDKLSHKENTWLETILNN